MGLAEDVLNFLFPPHCPLCGAYVPERGAWCDGCMERTMQILQIPLDPAMRRAVDGAWALGRYRGGLRNLVRALKYCGKRDRLPYLRTLLRKAEPALPLLGTPGMLAVPVPLHPAREKQRGFNQAELIFRDWLEEAGVPMERLLIRAQDTKPQYGLSAGERRRNLQGAFALAPGREARGRKLLLVDDILTTGATVCACASVLKAEGAERVCALVLASDHVT